MSVTIERRESHSFIRLDGDFTVTSATELKQVLLEGIAAGMDLHLDMEQIGAFDITAMQLLWAAGRAAAPTGTKLVIPVTEAVAVVAREAGFDPFPGLAVQG